MGHFIRIVLWTVALSSCLLAKPLLRDSNIRLMNMTVKCPSGLTLYTPSNVKEQCLTAALECFKTELAGTVRAECQDPQDAIDGGEDFLEEMMEELSSKPSSNGLNHTSECACETWPETSFTEFLKGEKALLQRIINDRMMA